MISLSSLFCSHRNLVLTKYKRIASTKELRSKHTNLEHQELRLRLTSQYWTCAKCGKDCGKISDYTNKEILA